MKYVVYIAMLFVCGFLFLPRTGTTEIRNLPLLLFILTLILIYTLIRFIKYVLLIVKTKKQLKKSGIKKAKIKFSLGPPFFTVITALHFLTKTKWHKLFCFQEKESINAIILTV